MPDEKRGSITIHRGSSGLVAEHDLFATRDGRLVMENDPQANTLIARKGMAIPDDVADRFGIKETKGETRKEGDEEKPSASQRDEAKPGDKQIGKKD